MSKRTPLRPRPVVTKCVTVCMGVLSALLGCVVLGSAFYGGFRVRSPWGLVSTTNAELLAWVWMGWGGLTAWLLSKTGGPCRVPPVAPVQRRWPWLLAVLVLVGMAWIRLCYTAYYPHLFDRACAVDPPLWMCHALGACVGLLCVGLWLSLVRETGVMAGTVGCLVIMSCAFSRRPDIETVVAHLGMVLGYGLVVAVVACLPRLRRLHVWCLVLVTVIVGIMTVELLGTGWASRRLLDQVASIGIASHLVWLGAALGGVMILFKRPGHAPLIVSSLIMVALAVALGGARDVVGRAGGVAAMMAVASLMGVGIGAVWRWLNERQMAYTRNVFVLLIVSLVLRMLRTPAGWGL